MPTRVTITESLFVRAEPEVVWDFTQDFARRTRWDASVLEAEVLAESPQRRVRIRGVGGLRCVLEYKQFERPQRTSLAMTEISGSPLIVGGGGSWSYERDGGATRWTQTNTLLLGLGPLGWLAAPLVRWQLQRATRKAMSNAAHAIDGLNLHARTTRRADERPRPFRATLWGLAVTAPLILIAVVSFGHCGDSTAAFWLFPLLVPVNLGLESLRSGHETSPIVENAAVALIFGQWILVGAGIDLVRWRRRRAKRRAAHARSGSADPKV
jgi:hypothetical protein